MSCHQAFKGMTIHQSRLSNVPVRPEGPPLSLHEGEGFLVSPPPVHVVKHLTVDCVNPVHGVGTSWLVSGERDCS